MAAGGAALSGRRRGRAAVCVLLLACATAPLAAQHVAAPGANAGDTLTVVPDSALARGNFHRKLFGESYRALWTAPIALPVFDLAKVGGGLTPTEAGGGMQTASLRFEGGDGREYVFRSLSKDPTKALPEDLRTGTLADFVRDQVAAAHPTAPLVVSRLLEAAGVLHVTPVLGILPDDPRLGEFRERFGGMIGFIEERPAAGKKRKRDFAGADDVEGTFDMFKEVARTPAEQPDRRAYVRARLMDFLLGDWDRHQDQWRWARNERGGVGIWRPIPRDRDQAFSNYEGMLLGVVRRAVPKLGTFDSTVASDVRGLMYNARVVDRHLLGGVAPVMYDSVAGELSAVLTDSVIAYAVAALPPEHLAPDSARLAGLLRARRDDLPNAAARFARILADDINLFGTEADDVVRIRRGNREVEVAIFASVDSARRDLPYTRRFTSRDVTHEFRVQLLEGDDQVEVTGDALGGPTVFVVTGDGNDEVRDVSSGGRLELFDADSLAIVEGSPKLHEKPWSADLPSEDNPVPERDWGEARSITPVLGYRSEYGVELGVNYARTDFGFRARPWLTRLSGGVSVATGSGGIRAEARYERYRRMSRSRWDLLARITQLQVIGFFGFGNENENEDPDDPSFNRALNTQVLVRPSFILAVKRHSALAFGPVLRFTHTRLDDDRLIGQLAPRGTPDYGQVGLQAEWTSDHRHIDSTGQRGVHFLAGGTWWPKVWDVTETVGEVHGAVTAQLPAPSLPLRPTLALRVGGRKVWGPYAWFDAAFVGGSRTVRGLREQRYAGDAGVLANAELRMQAGKLTLLLPMNVGLLGFTDVGRVFLEGETSNHWHAGFGGGLWFWAVGPENVVSLTLASAEGREAVYFTAGFMF
jgi:hypothetical protein